MIEVESQAADMAIWFFDTEYPTFDFFRSLIRTTPRRSPHRDLRPKAYDQHSKVEQLRSLIIDD